MSFPKRSVAAPCLCIKSGIIWTCDWCIPVVPHPNNRTCTHYTGDRRASNVRFCLGASGRKGNIQIKPLFPKTVPVDLTLTKLKSVKLEGRRSCTRLEGNIGTTTGLCLISRVTSP
jgi:hypothetical protein